MKRNSRSTLLLSFFVLALVCGVDSGTAATTGNVKGRVTDVRTGESLPGANVLIVGSGRGAVTNENGEYMIVGVNPGVYTLRISLLGYQALELQRVRVEADETSVYNVRLASEDIEIEGVVVEGQRPLVDVTKTAGDQTYGRDKIEQLPNVKGVDDILGLQAGVVKFGNQLFLRGGRANETQILVDGVPVNDVAGISGTAGTSTANEQLQALYSGTASGGALSVAANAIQSVTVSSSGLDAEFGNAQSGVVNVITKAGGDAYSGAAQYRTDGITSQGYGDRYYAANIGGPEPITNYLLPALGVEFPGKVSVFLSTTFNQVDGPYEFNTSQFYNPLRRKVKLGGFFGRLLNNAGFEYKDKQNNDFSYNARFTWQSGESDQLSYSYRANASSSQPLRTAYGWRNLYDSTTSSVNVNSQNVLQWNHILGTNSLLRSHISRLEIDRTSSVAGLTPDRYSAVTNVNDRDPNQDGFYDLGTAQSWSTSNTVIWHLKFDFNSQVHPLHFLKTGFEYYYEHVQRTSISFPLSSERQIDPNARGVFPGYGFARWVSNNTPSRGAIYVQDNIAFTGLNINLGLRYDFFYLGKQVFDQDFVQRWESVTREEAEWLEHQSFFSQFIRGNLSPRLAIGYPISTRTVFYFNYGHFLQYPDRDQFFRDPVNTTLSGNYVGNPALKPQKTVQYEAGFDQLIYDDLSLGIRGFYKDIFDYASFRRLPVSPTVDKYINLDYASSRGFEVIITKQLRNNVSGSLGYTFQIAKGRSSDPFAAQASPQLFGLPREVRLDFDQQHTLNMFLAYRVSPNEDFRIFGMQFNNWGASATWNFGSGFPYTPYNQGRSLEDLYLKNTGNGPYTSELNMSFFKGFNIISKVSVVFTLDVTNVLNRRNVDLNAGGFNRVTGRPLQFGDYSPDDPRNIYTWGGVLNGESFESRVPPFVFSPPRQISLGMRLTWD